MFRAYSKNIRNESETAYKDKDVKEEMNASGYNPQKENSEPLYLIFRNVQKALYLIFKSLLLFLSNRQFSVLLYSKCLLPITEYFQSDLYLFNACQPVRFYNTILMGS